MKLNWLDILLILLGLFIAYQLIKKLFGGSWETESILISLLIFNLGLTWRLNMKPQDLLTLTNLDGAQEPEHTWNLLRVLDI